MQDPGQELSDNADNALIITTRIHSDAVLVRVLGEINPIGARHLLVALGAALKQASVQRTALQQSAECPVVIDLTELTVTDAEGLLSALVGAINEAQDRRTSLRIVVDEHRPVVQPMQISGLDRFMVLYHSAADALAARD
jgi:anti-anti-sigma factor